MANPYVILNKKLPNEKADKLAKEAILKPITAGQLPYRDYCPMVKLHMNNKWQDRWNSEIENKLHSTKPNIGET